MEEILSLIYKICNDVFYLLYIILFYISMKKCFLREGKSKGKLLLITLFTNPITIIMASVLAVIICGVLDLSISTGMDPVSAFAVYETIDEYSNDILMTLISSFIYTSLIILFSRLIGKWLKTHNISLVTFIYLIFTILFVLSNGNVTKDTNESAIIFSDTVNLIASVSLNISLFLVYHFIIKQISALTDEKRTLNWKMFVIPPAVFLPIFFTFNYLTYELGGYNANIVFNILCIVILYLFIWAFYIIIKNINATNEALDAKDEVKVLSVEVMEALAHTIDAKDEYTRGHSVRVAKYSRMLAEKLGMSSEECESVYYMGLLHDIGKIGVPNEIINSTTKLTDEEYAVIKTHPVIGYDILAEIKSRPDLSIGARWHHERYDGKGYPDGISGEDIPFFARIIAVADSYDAMTSNRSYRKYLPQKIVRSEIENNKGTQFDPDIADKMLEIIDEDKEYILHE